MTVCSMKFVDLKSDTLKIMGVLFSYNKILQSEIIFLKGMMDIQSILKLWGMWNLTLERLNYLKGFVTWLFELFFRAIILRK